MQYRVDLKPFIMMSVLGVNMTLSSSMAWSDDTQEAGPLALRRIMQELGKNMQTVTEGISREDWALVADAAPRIAAHPKPPLGEKIRILAFIGTDADKFKWYDEKMQQAALTLEEAAARGDGRGVIAAFANLQQGCLACHQVFRKPFVEHFYEQR